MGCFPVIVNLFKVAINSYNVTGTPRKRKALSSNIQFNFTSKECEIHRCIVGPNNNSSGKISLPRKWIGEEVLLVRTFNKKSGGA